MYRIFVFARPLAYLLRHGDIGSPEHGTCQHRNSALTRNQKAEYFNLGTQAWEGLRRGVGPRRRCTTIYGK
jgi:hypothetical protein